MPTNTSSSSATEYMILFRSTNWESGLSPEDMQKIMAKTMAWFEKLSAQGKLKGAQPLFAEGKVISGKNGRVVSDGPFAEAKETVGGYLIVYADDLDEAVAIAQGWPLLDVDGIVEVRPIAPECPSFKLVKEQQQRQLAEATA